MLLDHINIPLMLYLIRVKHILLSLLHILLGHHVYFNEVCLSQLTIIHHTLNVFYFVLLISIRRATQMI